MADLCGWFGPVVCGQFAGDVAGLACADLLEYLRGLPQEGLGLRGVAVCQSAAAQASEGVRLVPGTADLTLPARATAQP